MWLLMCFENMVKCWCLVMLCGNVIVLFLFFVMMVVFNFLVDCSMLSLVLSLCKCNLNCLNLLFILFLNVLWVIINFLLFVFSFFICFKIDLILLCKLLCLFLVWMCSNVLFLLVKFNCIKIFNNLCLVVNNVFNELRLCLDFCLWKIILFKW